jgi:hypothetical protein
LGSAFMAVLAAGEQSGAESNHARMIRKIDN